MLILSMLEKMEGNSVSRSELNQLIKECVRISFNYIRRYHQNFNGGLPLGELSLRDAAFDAVVPLFLKSSTSKYTILDSYKSWNQPLISEQDATIFLHKVILRRVEQHITTLYQQADPVYAKLLKSLNYYINSNGYKKLSYFGMMYICEKGSEKIYGKVITADHFERLPSKLFQSKTDALLHNVLNYLKEKTEFYPAIPVNYLICRLKAMVQFESAQVFQGFELSSGLETGEIVNIGLTEIFKYIDDKYQDRFNQQEVRALRSALQDLAFDLRDGGINRSLYDYLHEHMTDLDKDEYYKRYQNILDYLLRLLKKRLFFELQDSK